MKSSKRPNDIDLLAYGRMILKRKWLVIVPALLMAVLAGILSSRQKPTWLVEAVFQPGRITGEASPGAWEEVLVPDLKHFFWQIDCSLFDAPIAQELRLDPAAMPKIRAENPKNTKLVRVWVHEKDRHRGVQILSALFRRIRSETDPRIDSGLKRIDSQIAAQNKEIVVLKKSAADVADGLKLLDLQKNRLHDEIASRQAHLRNSDDELSNFTAILRDLEKKIVGLDGQLKNTPIDKRSELNPAAISLYTSAIRSCYIFFGTLEDMAVAFKNSQGNARTEISSKTAYLADIEARIEKSESEIERIYDSKGKIRNQLDVLAARKLKNVYAQWVKEPVLPSRPIPNSMERDIFFALFLGLIFFSVLALVLEFANNRKNG